jgi:predicted tellurium resistance membrane protein TerC
MIELAFSFVTLALLEIVLGIDNLIFIALVVGNLPKEYRKKAQFIGISLALIIRTVMLFGATWLMTLTEPLFSVMDKAISFKDLLMLLGGIFLLFKATMEMHLDLSGKEERKEIIAKASFGGAVIQIAIIDFVFSFDSIITAVGVSNNLWVMVAAVVVSMIVMLMAVNSVTKFLEENPTFKILALSFILMIGMMLVADGLHFHIPRGYIYFSFAFAAFIEVLNTVGRKKREKRKKHD